MLPIRRWLSATKCRYPVESGWAADSFWKSFRASPRQRLGRFEVTLAPDGVGELPASVTQVLEQIGSLAMGFGHKLRKDAQGFAAPLLGLGTLEHCGELL